jgi:hypothetical protein
MGDRAIILVTDSKGKPPVCGIYLHWNASNLPAWLPEAFLRMRNGDVEYSTARCIGYFHEQIPGNLSLGVLPPPENLDPETLQEYSHGDGGVVLVTCDTGEVKVVGGYLGQHWKPPGVSDVTHAVVMGNRTGGIYEDWVQLGQFTPDRHERY